MYFTVLFFIPFFFKKHTQNQLDKYIKQNNSQFSLYLQILV